MSFGEEDFRDALCTPSIFVFPSVPALRAFVTVIKNRIAEKKQVTRIPHTQCGWCVKTIVTRELLIMPHGYDSC